MIAYQRGAITPNDLIMPLFIAVPLLILLQGIDLDRAVLDHLYDTRLHDFPLRRAWLTSVALHEWIRVPVIASGIVLLGALIAAQFSQRLNPWRRTIAFVLFAMVLGAGVVAVIKHFSAGACPYQLALYGGDELRLGLFDALPEGARPGRCWPGGHASTAFALFPWYFIARHYASTRVAYATLAGILSFGVLLTVVQTLRGTHWPSDQVYTALLCWYSTLGLYAVMGRQHFHPAARAAAE